MLDNDQTAPFRASDYLTDTSREYAIYVCSTRAIPAVQDGLKHGQRMALWVLRDRAEKLKTFALSGLLGYLKLHVHGEVSANNAIGLLAAPYKNNVPLIEGLGQFGNRVAPVEGIGAPRYTEVRRSKAAEAILYADGDLVPLADNFDGSNKQPLHFLPLIPTVLLNGVAGVAVGWSTDILPRSLSDLIGATEDVLHDREIRDLTPFWARYAVKVRPTGVPRQWEVAGQIEIADTSTLKVTELPPGIAIDAFRKRLIQMEDDESILGFTDRSTETINITIRMKRGTVRDWDEDKALAFFKLREKVSERIVVIDWNGTSIRTYEDPKDLVRDFTAWRLGWYTRRHQQLQDQAVYERTYWQAIDALFKAGFPQKLGGFANRKAVEDEVCGIATLAKVGIDKMQLDRIVSMPTYRWTVEGQNEACQRISALDQDIATQMAILASPDKLKASYLVDLAALKKLKL
jgi:DNA topoisomerase-2